jgi:hypothetical protein
MDFARRLLYMIARRTVRDLVIRAQPDYTPQMRTAAWHDLSRRDGHAERHFKDVAAGAEHLFASFLHFLSIACFENGFDIMRRLDIPNRLKWMKVCALAWLCSGKANRQIAFAADWKETGEVLEHRLREILAEAVDRCLAAAENGETTEEWVQPLADGGLQVFGINFQTDAQGGRISVPVQSP